MALTLANYHPKLREGVLGDVPETAGDKAFLADGELSETEIAALDRAQSVFGMDTFYRAWELDALTPNEVHAVLYILTFYDPYVTVHDVTADPDDPEAEGADLTRALDDFGVYPGACLYCKARVDHPINMYECLHCKHLVHPLAAFHERSDAHDAIFKTLRRMTLQHLAHHAKVQADALSPCDLRDFAEEEFVALGFVEFRAGRSDTPYIPYYMIPHDFTASVRFTDELLKFEKGFNDNAPRGKTSEVLIRPGEVLSPFTHAMRAAGGPPSERGLEPCLEAVKRIVDWDTKRYFHFAGWGGYLLRYFKFIFPAATGALHLVDKYATPYHYPTVWYPTWAWFLVNQSGGDDKGLRLMNQFRALNLPATRQARGVVFDKTAADASIALEGCCGVLLPAWDLYLHRNIGFRLSELQADIDTRIRLHPLPEHCGLERRWPGTWTERLGTREDGRGYGYWERGESSEYPSGLGPSLHDWIWWERSQRVREEILVYACD